MNLEKTNGIMVAIATLILAMLLPTGVNAQKSTWYDWMPKYSKSYKYVEGKAEGQILPILLYTNNVDEPTDSTNSIQIWLIYAPKVRNNGEVSEKKGYFFVFYIEQTSGENNFNSAYDDLFAYEYNVKGDYIGIEGTKIPRSVRKHITKAGVDKKIAKQFRLDKFRLAVLYTAKSTVVSQNTGSGTGNGNGKNSTIEEQDIQQKK